MIGKRIIDLTKGRVKNYKYFNTSQFDGAVTIYIKKRLFGCLWWIFVKDSTGMPVSFNKMPDAEAFMNGIIKYEDVVHHEYSFENGKQHTKVQPMTDNVAANEICKRIYSRTGETVPFDCAKGAWILSGRQYIHLAQDYAELWNEIYKFKEKKSWTHLIQ